MIDRQTFRAINTTCVAWLAGRDVSPAARAILLDRLAVLVAPFDADPDVPPIVRAACWLCRTKGMGQDVLEAERALSRVMFDTFLERSEDATRSAGLSREALSGLGLGENNKAA